MIRLGGWTDFRAAADLDRLCDRGRALLSELQYAVLDDYQEAAMQFGDWDSPAGPLRG
jgi:hypothetical protein